MTKPVQASRRNFIAGSSSFLALSSLPNYLNAAELGALKSQFSALNKQVGIVVYKEGDENSLAFASVFADVGMTLVALGIDPVRQWRDGLAAELAAQQQPVIGLTNWPDYLLMRGLAAELRRYPVLEAQHKVLAGTDNAWASAYAHDLLEISEAESLQDIQQALATAGATQPFGGRSLFSWIIT